ncbi:MAG: ketoacyl-ACP synthase III [Lentisphaeria bacterium]|jgi:3-oxoacyl-[acyl-carrier-protein] synthase-3
MKQAFANFQVRALAAALPAQRQELLALAPEFNMAPEELARILATTGIRTVRVAPPEVCASDLCAAAANQIFAATGLSGGDCDALVFVSQTGDYRLPATACLLQHRLGLGRDAATFDLNSGCTGFIHALFQAGLLLAAGAARRVLVCAGDTTTRLIHPQDKSVRLIFGDAGAAALVESAAADSAPAGFTLHADGAGAKQLIIPAGGCRQPATAATAQATPDDSGNLRSPQHLFMDGMEIMNFTLREVPPLVGEALAQAGWSAAETELFLLHQANKFILDCLRKKMRLPPEKVPVLMGETGNTGPASIPLALCQLQPPPGQRRKVLLCGFGVGLTWGAATLDLGASQILPPIDLP